MYLRIETKVRLDDNGIYHWEQQFDKHRLISIVCEKYTGDILSRWYFVGGFTDIQTKTYNSESTFPERNEKGNFGEYVYIIDTNVYVYDIKIFTPAIKKYYRKIRKQKLIKIYESRGK